METLRIVMLAALIAAVLWCVPPAQTQDAPAAPRLKIGDPAPPLQIASWAKGKPVVLADGKDKNIYVVEFWATWCPPCRESIPHLTALQKKYKDQGVVIVGVSAEESKVVEPFVVKQGEKMEYTVAVDKEEATTKAYLEAFGVNGIPHAFIIDREGRIAWAGHPMDGLDQALDGIVKGTFDPKAMESLAKARKLMQVYMYLLLEIGEPELAQTVAGRIMEYAGADAPTLIELAGLILNNPDLLKQGGPLNTAGEAARKAVELTQAKDADALEALAQYRFAVGEKTQAAELQRQAIELTTDPGKKIEREKTLKDYEGAKAEGAK
jgi:thiol-disulfide isomerase/thioredoxin